MMISPETFYESELKGKSAEEIMRKIRRLKREISQKKKELETAEGDIVLIAPSPKAQISCNREYLERAIEAYKSVGETYPYTRTELRAIEFQKNIPNIIKAEFQIGGYFGGYTTVTVDLTNEDAVFTRSHSLSPYPKEDEIDEDLDYSKEGWLEDLRRLFLGEWKKHYTNYEVLDGTQWGLRFDYADGSHTEFDGSNAFPYNFDDLSELFGICELTEE